MKQKDIAALATKTTEQLTKELTALQSELTLTHLKKAAGKLNDTSLVKRLADDLARIKTVLTQKQLTEGKV
jgi:ribosomal protein L29